MYKGIFISVFTGGIAWIVSHMFPMFNSVLFGLLLGIVLGNVWNIPDAFFKGIRFSGSRFLEISILFLAFGIQYDQMALLGWQSFLLLVLTVLIVLLATVFLSRKLKCPGSIGWMVGFGTAICGSSAIAALTPFIKKNREDAGIAIAVVNFYGTIGMILLPVLLVIFNLDAVKSSLLLGGTLHAVGNVAGAAYTMGAEIGDNALAIKLARVALLSPALLFFNFLLNRKEVANWKEHFRLPWYLWIFLLITVISSLFSISKEFLVLMNGLGQLFLTLAMVAIGLGVHFVTLFQSGKKGLFFGLVIFIVQLSVLAFGVLLIHFFSVYE